MGTVNIEAFLDITKKAIKKQNPDATEDQQQEKLALLLAKQAHGEQWTKDDFIISPLQDRRNDDKETL